MTEICEVARSFSSAVVTTSKPFIGLGQSRKCANRRDISPLGAALTRTALTRYGQQRRQPGVCVKFVRYTLDLTSPPEREGTGRTGSVKGRSSSCCCRTAMELSGAPVRQTDAKRLGKYKWLARMGRAA